MGDLGFITEESMKARYQIKRVDGGALSYRYTYYLLDTLYPEPGELGYRIVTSGFSNNPVAAPEFVRKLQARMNTKDVLD